MARHPHFTLRAAAAADLESIVELFKERCTALTQTIIL